MGPKSRDYVILLRLKFERSYIGSFDPSERIWRFKVDRRGLFNVVRHQIKQGDLVPLLGKPERVRPRSSTNIYYRQTSFIGEKLLYDMFSADGILAHPGH